MLGNPPEQIAGLPTDSRGYPVPAENHWIKGVPQLAHQDYRRCAALAEHLKCAICGFSMGPSEPRHRLFAFEEAKITLREGRCRRADGPGHYQCMLYAGTVCPFFVSERRPDVLRGAVRGPKSALLGFARVQLAFNDPSFETPVSFRYSDLIDQVWFKTGDNLEWLLAQAPTQVRVTPPEGERMYWMSETTIPEWELIESQLA